MESEERERQAARRGEKEDFLKMLASVMESTAEQVSDANGSLLYRRIDAEEE